MKCSCELEFWVRKAISQPSSANSGVENRELLASAVPLPPGPSSRSPSRGSSVSCPRSWGQVAGRGGGGLRVRWEQGAQLLGSPGERKAVFPLILIGLCDSHGAQVHLVAACRRLPRFQPRLSGGDRQLVPSLAHHVPGGAGPGRAWRNKAGVAGAAVAGGRAGSPGPHWPCCSASMAGSPRKPAFILRPG